MFLGCLQQKWVYGEASSELSEVKKLLKELP